MSEGGKVLTEAQCNHKADGAITRSGQASPRQEATAIAYIIIKQQIQYLKELI
jgi:hypothetical protein